ncbi:DUF6415 family natural product biosynthesis protein [Streptomyces hirsutus]|uniref:DUF6415 family natural product biosynthesis protein n=1 Tax=Streptomyces hirsutus TaxID=35620 RepID=UPI0033E15299
MASSTAVLDVSAIRSSYEAAFVCASVWEAERWRKVLVGHVRLLLPEVEALATQMSGDTQETAHHVIAWARDLLASDSSARPGPAVRVHDLAAVCRALLTLHEDPRLTSRGFSGVAAFADAEPPHEARPVTNSVTGQVLYTLVLVSLLGALIYGVARR